MHDRRARDQTGGRALRRVEARRLRDAELVAAHKHRAAAEAPQVLHDVHVVVCLDRVTDDVRQARHALPVRLIIRGQLGFAVQVEGLLGDARVAQPLQVPLPAVLDAEAVAPEVAVVARVDADALACACASGGGGTCVCERRRRQPCTIGGAQGTAQTGGLPGGEAYDLCLHRVCGKFRAGPTCWVASGWVRTGLGCVWACLGLGNGERLYSSPAMPYLASTPL
jgi:hypothetical protein